MVYYNPPHNWVGNVIPYITQPSRGPYFIAQFLFGTAVLKPTNQRFVTFVAAGAAGPQLADLYSSKCFAKIGWERFQNVYNEYIMYVKKKYIYIYIYT